MKDYLAMVTVEPGDKVDYGIKGMRWGIRRSPAQLKSAAAKRETDTDSDSSAKPSGSETSQARYNRLKAQAAEKGANSLTDEELKFVDKRTEAIKKVAKLTEEKPNWLKDATETVLKQAAQRQMQSVSNLIADKYITDRISNQLKGGNESKTPLDYVGKHRAKKK